MPTLSMTIEWSQFVTALLVGIGGSLHCLGMCGGVHGLLGFPSGSTASKRTENTSEGLITTDRLNHASVARYSNDHVWHQYAQQVVLVCSFNAGRILSYALAGLIFGALSFAVGSLHDAFIPMMRLLSGILLVIIAIQISGWKDPLGLEKLGSIIWRQLQPLISDALPIRRSNAAFIAGTIWGWVPCGLVYSVLAWAALEAHPVSAAIIMLGFGLGTFPSMVLSGVSVQQFGNMLSRYSIRPIMTILLLAFAGYSIWQSSEALFISSVENGPQYHCHP